ncbi:hypothetical protein ARSEF4850_007058 [Beauveria asiatica]
MHWVGSKYIAPEMDQKLLLDIARLSVDESQTKRANGFTVQAMTVLLVALDGTGYPQQAVELLTRTKQMALSLGMNYSQFMTESKTRFRVLDESWRRTWWELYVLDGMFAGAHRATTFSLLDVPNDVGLLCEDDDYETDQIPEPCSLEDLSDRDLSIERCDFSSFSYRVLSVQNLGKVIQHYEAAEVDANVHALRQMSSVWGLATKALGQVREVAGHVHFVRTQSRQMEQFLVDVTEEDMMSMFAADTSTLADIDTF